MCLTTCGCDVVDCAFLFWVFVWVNDSILEAYTISLFAQLLLLKLCAFWSLGLLYNCAMSAYRFGSSTYLRTECYELSIGDFVTFKLLKLILYSTVYISTLLLLILFNITSMLSIYVCGILKINSFNEYFSFVFIFCLLLWNLTY